MSIEREHTASTDLELTEADLHHIKRLQDLRSSGDANMVTELLAGLKLHYSDEVALSTYGWVLSNSDIYFNSEWPAVEIPDDLPEEESPAGPYSALAPTHQQEPWHGNNQ